MNGGEFIELSRRWIASAIRDPAEPVYRSAVSRAYYGAFHLCSELVENTLQLAIPKLVNRHEKLPVVLGYTAHADLLEVGHRLHDLKERRHEADYDILRSASATSEAAEQAVDDAKWIEEIIKSFVPQAGEVRRMQSAIEKHFDGYLSGWRIKIRL